MTKKQKKSLKLVIIAVIFLIVCKILPFENFGKYALYTEMLCYLVPYLVAGTGILIKALRNLFSGRMLDENFLMAVATIGAFLLGDFSEAVMVVLFYRVGVLFEGYATEKSRKSIEELMNIMPSYANIKRENGIVTVDPTEVRVGDVFVVKAGEKIPLDGKILSGNSTVDAASLTGESCPVNVSVGDKVISGSINGGGVLEVLCESEYENSTVGKILELIQNSVTKKAKTESFITRFAVVYTPVVVASAVILGVVPPLFGFGNFAMWIKRALTFLVISCPCALVISVPLSFFGGMGTASKRGILVKGAIYLERLNKIKYCLFDKTGTLTKGSFKVTAVHPEKVSESELLRIAAAAEMYSDHPISVSLLAACGKVPDLQVENVAEIAGEGVTAKISGKTVLVGNEKLMQSNSIEYHNCHLMGTVVHVAMDNEYMGHIIISDEIKSGAKETVMELNKLGVNTVMLSGDRKNIAEDTARQLGVNEVYSELLPDAKVKLAEQFKSKCGKDDVLAFVGDGINDAPVLLNADLGISMGALGSDAAIEAADIVIMDDAVEKIITAKKIARKTMNIIWQNITFSLLIKLIVLVLGAFGYAPMWLAIFADVGVSVIAILNATRAMMFK